MLHFFALFAFVFLALPCEEVFVELLGFPCFVQQILLCSKTHLVIFEANNQQKAEGWYTKLEDVPRFVAAKI